MPRPRKNRKIAGGPAYPRYKPAGIPSTELETIILTLDELEALRLADFEGLYQEEAAQLMEVSRQTFGNIITSARGKTADALINGKQLFIDGGNFEIDTERIEICKRCGGPWRALDNAHRRERCPACRQKGFRHRRAEEVGDPEIESS